MGHARVSELAESMKLEWSDAALADIDRFVEFLNREHPSLAGVVAGEILGKVRVLSEHPMLGGRSPGGKSTDKLYCRSWVRLASSNIASMENVW
jgi:plasmid stabilization system protein ParE